MDYLIFKYLNSFAGHKEWLDILGLIIAEHLIFVLPIIVFIGYYFFNKKKNIFSIFLKILFSLILVYGLNYLIGVILKRPRPFVSHREVYQLSKFFAKPSDYSFPSCHTAIAFVFVFSVLLDWKKFGIILIMPAIMIGLGRIFVGVHYPLDILGGILIAFISSFFVHLLFKREFVNIWKH